MKIVLVGPAFPLRGGIATFLAELYQKLHDRGHDVHFVSFIKQFPNWLFPGKTQLDASQKVIDVHPVPAFAPLNYFSWKRTAQEIAKHNPDLVIFKWWMPFFGPGYWAVTRGVRKKTNAHIAYILDNVIPHERRPGDRFFTRLAFRHVHHFIAQSRAVERDFFAWLPEIEKSRVNFAAHPPYDAYPQYSGSANEARDAVGLPRGGRLLLFFGFIREYKGLDILLRAMPAILKDDPDTRLAVVGEFYDPRESYDKLIAELNLQNHVFIHDDYCPNERVSIYFAAADVIVLPYRSATQSGIIHVAYSHDMPVITTSVGGLGEVVLDGSSGLIVPPENPQQIAAAVKTYFDSGGRPNYINGVRSENQKYSWENFLATIEKFKD